MTLFANFKSYVFSKREKIRLESKCKKILKKRCVLLHMSNILSNMRLYIAFKQKLSFFTLGLEKRRF